MGNIQSVPRRRRTARGSRQRNHDDDHDQPPPPYVPQNIDVLAQDIIHPPPRHDISKSLLLVLAELSHSRHSTTDDDDKLAAIWHIICSPGSGQRVMAVPSRSIEDDEAVTETASMTLEDIWLHTVLAMPYQMQLELAFGFPLGRKILAVNADEKLPPPTGAQVLKNGIMLPTTPQEGCDRAAPAWVPPWRQIKRFPTSAWESWFRICFQVVTLDLPQPSLIREIDYNSRFSLDNNMSLELEAAVVFPRCKMCCVTNGSWQDPVAGGKYRVSILEEASGYENSSKIDVTLTVPDGVTQKRIISSQTGWRKVYIPEPHSGPSGQQRYTLVTWVDLSSEMENRWMSGSIEKTPVPWVVCVRLDPRTGQEIHWEGETWRERVYSDDEEDEEDMEENDQESLEDDPEEEPNRPADPTDSLTDPDEPIATAAVEEADDGWIHLRKVAILMDGVGTRDGSLWSRDYKNELRKGIKCRFV